MRLTVGPLPPAVYWRRRAVVLGVGFLFLLVVLWSCSSEPGKSGPTAGQTKPTTPPAGAQTTGPVLTPQSGAPGASAPPDGGPAGANPTTADQQQPAADPPAAAGGTVPDVPPPAAGSCTDEEISVVPVPSTKSIRQGGTVGLQLKIKNTSNRTCSRDLGADLQELFIKSGAEKIWSSDTCGGKGSNVVSLTPNEERTFQADWNGNRDSKCSGGLAAGPNAEPGTYQIFARLGTKHSEPVALTITN
jgi:hypothetical protein